MQAALDFDVTARKHGGNPESVAAHERVKPHKLLDRERVLSWVSGSRGVTAKDVARIMGRQLNSISGRFSELAAEGLITRTGERREGCAVWVTK